MSKAARKPHPLAARIKRVMQADDEVGKIAQATPFLMERALELFLQQLCERAADVAQQRGAKTITPSHLKHVVKSDDLLDFLKNTLESAPDLPEGMSQAPKPKRQRAEKKEPREPKVAKTAGGSSSGTAAEGGVAEAAAVEAGDGAPGGRGRGRGSRGSRGSGRGRARTSSSDGGGVRSSSDGGGPLAATTGGSVGAASAAADPLMASLAAHPFLKNKKGFGKDSGTGGVVGASAASAAAKLPLPRSEDPVPESTAPAGAAEGGLAYELQHGGALGEEGGEPLRTSDQGEAQALPVTGYDTETLAMFAAPQGQVYDDEYDD